MGERWYTDCGGGLCASLGGYCDACADAVEYDADEEGRDLGVCPYYARHEGLVMLPTYAPEGVCVFGCSDEPQCVTCAPLEGWPSVHKMLAAVKSS